LKVKTDLILHVENIPIYITNRQLAAAFELYGPVISAELSLDQSGNSVGHGIVHMAEEDGRLAQHCLTGVHWGAARLGVRPWAGTACRLCKAA
jgi:hypothetical protein